MSSHIPRIEFETLPNELQQLLGGRMRRLGYLGEFFKIGAHQPEALAGFIRFTEASKNALPENLAELVALTVATRLGNRYERHQHERLSLALGLPAEWVSEVERLAPGAGALDADERAVQQYVLQAIDNFGVGAGEAFEAMVSRIGPPAAVAVAFLVGRFVAHGIIANTLAFEPPVPSIFEPKGASE